MSEWPLPAAFFIFFILNLYFWNFFYLLLISLLFISHTVSVCYCRHNNWHESVLVKSRLGSTPLNIAWHHGRFLRFWLCAKMPRTVDRARINRLSRRRRKIPGNKTVLNCHMLRCVQRYFANPQIPRISFSLLQYNCVWLSVVLLQTRGPCILLSL